MSQSAASCPQSTCVLPLLLIHGPNIPGSYVILHRHSVQLSSVQLLSRAQLFATPWITAHQAFLSVTNSQSIPKLMAIESVMPSSHQKEKLNRFQRNEPRTINDSSYYADMLIQIYLFMEVDIQSGSRQKREFKRKEFEMCLIVQLPACCFSNWPTRLGSSSLTRDQTVLHGVLAMGHQGGPKKLSSWLFLHSEYPTWNLASTYGMGFKVTSQWGSKTICESRL